MKAKIFVMPKKEVLDPQGKAVGNSLSSLGFSGINKVRVGKLIEITLDNNVTEEEKEKKVHEMCRKLLVNEVIEDYSFELS